MALLETKNISKSYGAIDALVDVNLKFTENKIYGLYGRNGAGKTTLLDIISSRIYADQGMVFCSGQDVSENPGAMAKICCYMPEKHYFPGWFRVNKLLSYAQKSYPYYNKETEERLCKIFDLNTLQKYKELSRGFQSIFRIVLGLASNASITIFDEPVMGLDAVARDRFYQELIEAFSQNHRLFIISTHLIEESADLFNEAIIIHQGKILEQASVESLLSKAFYVSGKADRVNDFLKNKKVLGSQTINDLKTAVVEGNPKLQKSLTGLRFSDLTIQKLFIHMTNRQKEQELGL